jgi:hypothetical protein
MRRVPDGPLADPELWAWQQAMGLETSLIRTRDFRRLRFRESIDMPDLEFFILLARERGEFISIPDYVTEYRLHGYSTTARRFVSYPQLVDLLTDLQVSETVEPYKARMLESLTVNAIIQSICTGDVECARRLLHSHYFCAIPHWLPRAPVARLCSVLPGRLAARFFITYRLVRSLRPAAWLSPAKQLEGNIT